MTPNIAERVKQIQNNHKDFAHKPMTFESGPFQYMPTLFSATVIGSYKEDIPFLLSLVDKYQKLVEGADILLDINLHKSAQRKHWNKAREESGLFEDKKVGE